MNWKLLLGFGSIGIVMGILSVMGLLGTSEPWVWMGFSLLTAWILSRKLLSRKFVYAMLIGFLWGLLYGVVQAVMFETYLENNALFGKIFDQGVDASMSPRLFPLVSGPIFGLLVGALTGALVLVFTRVSKPKH